MRPIDSSYDRQIAHSRSAIDLLTAGSVLSYEEVEHLDDAAWAEIRDRAVEAPGRGYLILTIDGEERYNMRLGLLSALCRERGSWGDGTDADEESIALCARNPEALGFDSEELDLATHGDLGAIISLRQSFGLGVLR